MPGLIGAAGEAGAMASRKDAPTGKTGGIEPGRLQLADQPAPYLTGFPEWRDAPLPVEVGAEVLARD